MSKLGISNADFKAAHMRISLLQLLLKGPQWRKILIKTMVRLDGLQYTLLRGVLIHPVCFEQNLKEETNIITFFANMNTIRKFIRALKRSESYNLCKDRSIKRTRKMSTGDIVGASESTVVECTLYDSQQAPNQESSETEHSRVLPEIPSSADEKSVCLKSTQNHADSSLEKVYSRKDKQDHNETDSLIPHAQKDEQQVFQATRTDVDLQAAASQGDRDEDSCRTDQSTSEMQPIKKDNVLGVPRSLMYICADTFTPEKISQFLNSYGTRSKRGSWLLSWLCSELKYLSNDIIRVWVGYETGCTEIPVFVAVIKQTDKSIDDRFKSICQFKVVQRLTGEVSGEAKRCLKYENDYKTSLEDVRELHDAVADHAADLLKYHSNLQIVSASTIKSKQSGNVTEVKTCIVLYVHVKGIIPFHEKPFPTTVGNFPTDIREGIFQRYAGSKLTIGCEIFSTYRLKGRLGAFVCLSNGKLGCVTCWHMFDTPQSREDQKHGKFDNEVYQFPPVSGQRPFGSIIQKENNPGDAHKVGFDAALIEIIDRLKIPEDGRFHISYGADADQLAEFHSGEILTSTQEIAVLHKLENAKCKIIRYNERTNQRYTRSGIMNFGNASLSWSPATPEEKCQLFNQIEVHPDPAEIIDINVTLPNLVR